MLRVNDLASRSIRFEFAPASGAEPNVRSDNASLLANSCGVAACLQLCNTGFKLDDSANARCCAICDNPSSDDCPALVTDLAMYTESNGRRATSICCKIPVGG